MIVCSCNVLDDKAIRTAVKESAPRSAGQVYGCLGCSAQCGRCVRTIRQIMDKALADAQSEAVHACNRGCCPVGLEHAAAEPTL